jgi:hypothetical protein
MDFLSLINPISQVVNKVIDMIPDPNAKQKAQLEIQTAIAMAEIENTKAQLEINKVEAASPNWFVSGWRPAVGWICALALCYVAIFEPVARFIAQVAFGYGGTFPEIDTNLTMQVLLGLLGLGAMRTAEKIKGTAR